MDENFGGAPIVESDDWRNRYEESKADDEQEEFTQEQVEKYLKEDGNYCPYCGSKNTGSIWNDSTWEGEDLGMKCRDCGRKWKEIYILTLVDLQKDNDD